MPYYNTKDYVLLMASLQILWFVHAKFGHRMDDAGLMTMCCAKVCSAMARVP